MSSGLPLSSKGITKLIIEEKMWCIPVVYSSSFTRVGADGERSISDMASIKATLDLISWRNDNTCTAVRLIFTRHRCQNSGQVRYIKKNPNLSKIPVI